MGGQWHDGIQLNNIDVVSMTAKSIQVALPRFSGFNVGASDNELLWIPFSQIEGPYEPTVGVKATIVVTKWWWSKIGPSLKMNNVDMSFASIKGANWSDGALKDSRMEMPGHSIIMTRPAKKFSLKTPADCHDFIKFFVKFFNNPTDLEKALNNSFFISDNKLVFTIDMDVESLLLDGNLPNFSSDLIQTALEEYFKQEESAQKILKQLDEIPHLKDFIPYIPPFKG